MKINKAIENDITAFKIFEVDNFILSKSTKKKVKDKRNGTKKFITPLSTSQDAAEAK
jgi:hypothetical protein